MSLLVLDTSAFSNLRRGHEEVLDHMARADTVALPTIVLGELEAGFRLGSRYRDNARVLAEFLDELFVTVLPVTGDVGRRYGSVFSKLRESGTSLPINDVWIAATTLEHSGQLLTFDSNFERVEDLRLTLLR